MEKIKDLFGGKKKKQTHLISEASRKRIQKGIPLSIDNIMY